MTIYETTLRVEFGNFFQMMRLQKNGDELASHPLLIYSGRFEGYLTALEDLGVLTGSDELVARANMIIIYETDDPNCSEEVAWKRWIFYYRNHLKDKSNEES